MWKKPVLFPDGLIGIEGTIIITVMYPPNVHFYFLQVPVLIKGQGA